MSADTRGLRRIRPAEGAADLERVRALFTEYAGTLGFDLSFQDFDRELADLPGAYGPPGGCILIASGEDEDAGCVALRPLAVDTCEMKRLYVRPTHRGSGLGRELAERVIEEARKRGYRIMRLDTVPAMGEAIALYRSLGFRPIPPYRENPVPGAMYFELELGE